LKRGAHITDKEDAMKAMFAKIEALTNQELLAVWTALKHYDPKDFYDRQHSITMDDWANAIYSNISRRGLCWS
jgi:hypothetical protein